MITLKLTPTQARVLWNVVDGQSDAGACEGGNTRQEAAALEQISSKLLAEREKWKGVKLRQG